MHALKSIEMKFCKELFVILITLSIDFDLCFGSAKNTCSKDCCPKECTCSPNLATINCARKKLTYIPKDIPSSALILYLGYNSISKIERETFKNLKNLKELYLNDNKISLVEQNAFEGLSSLKVLSFSTNKLFNLESEVFTGLNSLEKLYLTRNNLEKIPDFASIFKDNLTLLTIDNNNLSEIGLCKTEYVLYNKLSTLVLSNNKLSSLRSKDFVCLKRLLKINLSRNKITNIEPETFSPLEKLQSVALSYNENFSWKTLTDLTESLGAIKTLSSLDLSGVFVNDELEFNSKTFTKITQCPLRYLLLSHSTKTSIENGTFSGLDKLETLDLSQGEFYEIKDHMLDLVKLKELKLQRNSNLRISTISKLSLQNLEILNLDQTNIKELKDMSFSGFHKLKTLILSGSHINKIYSNAFAGLAYLTNLDLSKNEIGGSNIPSKIFSGSPDLMKVNLSRNKMTTMSTQYTLFKGLYQLETLDLSNNNCYNISEGMFWDQKNLKSLNLSGNKLGQYFSKLGKNSQLFFKLSSLVSLNLNRNEISSLPDNLFNKMNSTEIIDLSNNYVASFKPELYKEAHSLELIDLSRNYLIQISPEDITSLPQKTKLDLSNNTLDCSCDLRPFMYWLRTKNSSYIEYKLINIKNYRCETPMSMAQKSFLDFNPDSIAAFCNWVYILIGSLLALFAVVLTCSMLIYHYRWSIRFRWYLFTKWSKKKPKRHRGTYESIPSCEDKTYEITICFHENDEDWVSDKLIPRLEQWKRGDHEIELQVNNNQEAEKYDNEIPGFFFAAGHTTKFGSFVFDEICNAMEKSKRIVHCITKDYLKSARHKEEIKMAIHFRHELNLEITGDEGLFLILLEPNVDLELPPTIRPLLADNKFLQWSTDTEREALFWQDLQEALKLN